MSSCLITGGCNYVKIKLITFQSILLSWFLLSVLYDGSTQYVFFLAQYRKVLKPHWCTHTYTFTPTFTYTCIYWQIGEHICCWGLNMQPTGQETHHKTPRPWNEEHDSFPVNAGQSCLKTGLGSGSQLRKGSEHDTQTGSENLRAEESRPLIEAACTQESECHI